jgi:amino acid permease
MLDESSSSNIVLRIRKNELENSAIIAAKRFIWPTCLIILILMMGALAINSKMAGKEQKNKKLGNFFQKIV